MARRARAPIPPAAPDTDALSDSLRPRIPARPVVRYNDWPAINVPSIDAFAPVLPVSVVVSYFEAPRELELAMAALERQTYPRKLFEVIVVDDGSAMPAKAPRNTPLNVRIVRQENRGFGLARARNNGARAATHELLVFLDGDMIPDARMLAAHARWHHVAGGVLTFGFRSRLPETDVDADRLRDHSGSLRELFGGAECDPWRETRLRASRDLTSRGDNPFMAVLGCNFAIRKAFYEQVGGSDESFRRYGWEDTELAYRVHAHGGLLIPEREARSWHDARTESALRHQAQNIALQRAKVAQRIPHEECRRTPPSGQFSIYAVPRHVVTVEGGGASPERIGGTVERILADPAGDLAVRVELGPAPSGRVSWLEDRFGPDPRVQIEPLRPALDEFAATPFHLTVPAGGAFRPGLVAHLRRRLRSAVFATLPLPGRQTATIARGWALHRARCTGKPVASFGKVVTIRRRPWVRLTPRGEARRAALARIARALDAETRSVRNARAAVRFLRWLLRRARLRRAEQARQRKEVHRPRDAAPGVRIATAGPRAAAAFAASARIAPYTPDRRIDVLLADTREEARGISGLRAVVAAAPRLGVPALDPRVAGPTGWVRDVAPCAAALGATGSLPHPWRAHVRLAASNREALHQAHHLIDAAPLHADPVSRAGALLRVAASGLPVHLVDDDSDLAHLLGAELHELMTDPALPGADPATREAFSIRMRRIALGAHSVRARVRQVCEAAGLAGTPRVPGVSVLLASGEPESLARALRNVARQTYPNLELILVRCGGGIDDDGLRALTASLPMPVQIEHADPAQPPGSILNNATEAANGDFVCTLSDSAVYDAHHIGDLVLAHEYSAANLVGKGVETVYLADAERTVRVIDGRTETYTNDLAPGALLIARQDLVRFGGWPAAPRAVHRALIDAVGRTGGTVYRTHSRGFLTVSNTGSGPPAALDAMAPAEASCSGWHPELAGIKDVSEGPPPAGPPVSATAPVG